MKAIQITVDETLLREIDRLRESEGVGRSAVFRQAAEEYLRRQRKAAIADQYAHAYGSGEALDEELDGWDREGAWPAE